jgi:hypothetical protein
MSHIFMADNIDLSLNRSLKEMIDYKPLTS